MSAPKNPPAFPVKVKRNTSTDPLATPREFQMEGMTLRDWFAGQVLAGICADPEWGDDPTHLASFSYTLADAMLAERAKGNRAGH
jgi:hypothetical protein